MRYSRSAITQLTRWYRQILIKCAILNAAIIAGSFGVPALANASEINQNGVPFQTATSIEQNGNIFNISTTTTNGAGDVGLNTFGQFNVSEGDVANLNLINQQNKLVNLVFDSSASQINGIVNSYKGGEIGGNVLFANPNGFVVGKTGVFNVGSLTLMTPTEDTMKNIFTSGAVNEEALNGLVSFNMKGKDYLLLDNDSEVELNPAEISIDGTINSGAGIAIINGGSEVNIKENAKLNANMNFSVSGGNVTASKKDGVDPTPITQSGGTLEYKLAMDGGNGVVVVSQNKKVKDDYLAAIVNLDGKVDANHSDVVVQTEIYNTGIGSASEYDKESKHDVALSKVTVGGKVSGRNVALNARTDATSVNNKLLSYDSSHGWLDWLGPEELNFLISDFFNMADMKSAVEILSSAKITADDTLSVNANTGFVATTRSIFVNLAFNYTDVDIITEAILRSGSQVTAQNLNVLATTNVQLITAAQATNITETAADVINQSYGHGGAYALTVALMDVANRAVIEKAVNLAVAKNIKVDAEMYRTYEGTTKNGLIPMVDKNFGIAGIGVGIFVGDTINEAIMESSADITGTLDVVANYIGATNNNITAIAEAKGESSQAGLGGKIFMFFFDKMMLKYKDQMSGRSYNRAQGSFDNIKIAATVGVSVDNVVNTARIGNKDQGAKPDTKAANINLNAKLTDYKSNLYTSSAASDSVDSASGSVAVNVKGLDSNATAYGDFTLKDIGYFEYIGQKAGDYILLEDGTRLTVDEGQKITQNYNAYIYTAEEQTTRDGKNYITLPNGKEIEGNKGDKVIIPLTGFAIKADTIVKHGLSYYDWIPDLFDWVSDLFSSDSEKKQSPDVKNIDSANVGEYLSATTNAEDIQKKVDGAGNLNIINAIDFNVLGAAQLFNTFASSSATAVAKDQATKAYSGALSVAVHNTVAKAILEDNSSVTFNNTQKAQSNTLDIKAHTDSELWAGAALMGILNNITTGGGGSSARDGDSAGGALSFQWGSADTIANIGENVTVVQKNNSVAGDVIVDALDETDGVNVVVANGSADESGIAGAVSISAIDAGKVEAAIKSSNIDNAINGKDVKVTAKKDLTHVNANVGVTMAEDALGLGIAVNYADDEAVSYIAGNINALQDLVVNSDYDKLFINGAINVGFTKTGTDTPRYQDITDEQRQRNLDNAQNLLDRAEEIKNSDRWYNFGTFRSLWNARNASEALANSDYDFTRAINTDKETSGKAAMVSVNISDVTSKAYIADGAKISAGRDVTVQANSEDMLINGTLATTFNGKSGMGGAFIGQWTENNVEAYIGNAIVDAARDMNVNAKEKLNIFTGSVSVVQGKDKAIAGNISLDIQSNAVSAAIKDGAKINTLNQTTNQTVNVTADVDSLLIKGVGSVSVQAGGSSNGAKGGTLDADIAVNDISAYIKNATVNASKEINVKADNRTHLITVDMAGAVATADSSYAGTLGAYVAINEESAYIEGTEINTLSEFDSKNADINVTAASLFDDLAIVGTVAYGNESSADASIRVDGTGDQVNSYIKSSNVYTNGKIKLKNDTNYDSLIITAAGAISKGTNAMSGAIAIAVNSAVQKNYIEDSTINAGVLEMDADAIFNALGITGVIAANLSGQGIGGSVYLAVIDNDINNYIKNSPITSIGDINLISDMDIDSLSIIFAGSGGEGMAASGAISTIVNSADVETYILSESGDKKVFSQQGKVNVKSTNNTDIETINGAVSISIGDNAAGGSLNTVVDNSDVAAGIEGMEVKAGGNVDVEAKSKENIMSIAIGGAGGSGVAVSGSVNSVVLASDTDAYIKNSLIQAAGANVSALGDTEITGGTGSASISFSSMALGASIVTGIIDNEVKATIENSQVETDNDVTVSAQADEKIGTKEAPFITLAGGFSQGVTVEGVIATMVLSSTADAHIKGTRMVESVPHGIKAEGDVQLKSDGNAVIYAADGAAGGGYAGGVGATVNTIVVDKDTIAKAENTQITAQNITAAAKENDSYFTTVVAAGGGGTAGLAGVVNTNVITSRVEAGISGSVLTDAEKITATAIAAADMQTITGAVGGAGAVGVGLSAVNDIIKYTVLAYTSGIDAEFKELSVTAAADSNYQFTTVSGAGGGAVGGAGVENVNYVNNLVKAYADGVLRANRETDAASDKVAISATDTVKFNYPIAGMIAGGGAAGIGGTVMVNTVTSTVQAYIGGSKVRVKDIDVSATGSQTYDNIVAAGFSGGGVGAFTGTVLANVIDTTIQSYIMANSDVVADDIDITADNKVKLIAFTGAGAIGGTGAFGTSVNVNSFTTVTEAYTGENVVLNAENITVSANSKTDIGEKGNKLIAAAGSAGIYAGIAGSVIWNTVENKTAAYIGKNNTIALADNGKLDLSAKDTTSVYESMGAGGVALIGIGASVGGNEIRNTVLAFIGTGSSVTGTQADVSIVAESIENVDAMGFVVSAIGGAFSGGAIYTGIGKKVGDASYNEIDAEEKRTYIGTQNQTADMNNKAAEKNKSGDENYKTSYNASLDRMSEKAKGTRIAEKEKVTESLYVKTGSSSLPSSDRDGTTSAFIDTASSLNVKKLNVNAQNTDDIKMETDGYAAGVVAVGVSVALAEDNTTTNAFISNGVTVNAERVEIKAESIDEQHVETEAAQGGIVAGGGSTAQIHSDKTTNAYVLQDTKITTTGDLDIKTEATTDIVSSANANSYGPVAVGVSAAIASTTGASRINIGDNVALSAGNVDLNEINTENAARGKISIQTNTDDKAKSEAFAATGGIGSGSGATTRTHTGKNNSINIGKNFTAVAEGDLNISSNANNNSKTKADGRAYGGVSAGGATGNSEIDQTSGIIIADADSEKGITASTVNIVSLVNNDAKTDVYAGAGAILGIPGSEADVNIKSVNSNYVGKNYVISTEIGDYLTSAATANKYKGFVNSDAYGVVTVAIPFVRNYVDSTVKSISEADITSAGTLIVAAKNDIIKEAVVDYDLYGGAGGLASGAGGSIKDHLSMTTNARLGGNKAYANGQYGNGSIVIGAYNVASVNEKSDLYAHGGIIGSDTDSMVYLTANAKTEIANKDIKTHDDDINFVARNDVDIYTKSNVESYGGVSGTGGVSQAESSQQHADVIISGDTRSMSGRSTIISALSNKSLEAYIYERTRGAFSVISGHAYAYNYDSESSITIDAGAQVKSYDSMNLTALSSTQKIKATRDAIAYQLWGIPYKGSGNTETSNKNSAGIIINGAVESGIGANRKLLINKDGTYESDGVNVLGQKKIGEITPADIDTDIQIYKDSKENATKEYNDFIADQDSLISDYEKIIQDNTKAKEELEKQNDGYRDDITIWSAISDIDAADFVSKYGTSTIEVIRNLVMALESGDAGAITSAKQALLAAQPDLTVAQLNEKISENNNSIADKETVIELTETSISAAESEKHTVTMKYYVEIALLDKYIRDLEDKRDAGSTIDIYVMTLDNVKVRSGETNVTTDVLFGTGSITAPGKTFTITVDNKSVNSVQYGDLIIDRNLDGDIHINAYDSSSISKNIINPEYNSKIAITNYVDANDPTIDYEGQSGDIWLKGNIENVNGIVDITNFTGSILSEGSITARDLYMKAPNGEISQMYDPKERATGSMVAGGDISYAAKTININGLIQSGSELKNITIPEFSVIKKDDGNYYQIIDGVESEMKPSEMTEGYYYLTLLDYTDTLNSIQKIKTYFKPTLDDEGNPVTDASGHVMGDIYLFKAHIGGGNITLTGNIVSDSNEGKIVLINGYGHIDVVNNSEYDLVTSALNADDKVNGVLTINDFKFASGDDTTYDTIKQEDLTPEYLAAHAGTYTAYIDEDDNISTTSANITEGNGFWGETSSATREDGATIHSTTYNPGSDAYMITEEGKTVSYQVYIKRSWIVELFCGKKYETRYYYQEPVYGVRNNAIAVNFQGFDKPSINVTAKGNVVMNSNISALPGDVNITSVNGDILTKSSSHVISAENITLAAKGNIGEEVVTGKVYRPIQTAVYNDGKLIASGGGDVYINFPYTEISNIKLNAGNGSGNVRLATARDISNNKANDINKEILIKADDLELNATQIGLDTTVNENIDLDIKKLKARSQGDISITNKGDITISSIVSENNGTITIESREGSIIAAADTGTYSGYHIHGGDIVLKALNGAIKSEIDARGLSFAHDGRFHVEARDKVSLSSVGNIYVDLIRSLQGDVTVEADRGIIASAITDEDRYYNIAGRDISLKAWGGSIENIALNADGTVEASTFYSGLGDVNIAMVSQKPLDENSTAEEIEAFKANAKDLKISCISAGNNVTISGEKGIKQDYAYAEFPDFGVSGERITLNAADDIGSIDAPVNTKVNRTISVFGSEDSSVYLSANNAGYGIKIDTIDTHNGTGTLDTIGLISAGNILNNAEKDEDIINLRADNILLEAQKNIGSVDDYMVVETTSADEDKGLVYKAENAYIVGVGSILNILDGKTSGTAIIDTENTDIIIQYITSNSDVTLEAQNSIKVADADINGNLNASALDIKINEMKVEGNFNALVDNLFVNTSNNLNLGNISGISKSYVENAAITSAHNINNGLGNDEDVNISAKNIDLTAGGSIGEGHSVHLELAVGNKVNIKAGKIADLHNTGAMANYKQVTADDARITADNDVNIADLDTDKLTLKTVSENINITGDVKTAGTINTASKNIVIDNTSLAAYPYADVQLYLTQKPMHLIINKSNNVITESQNVTRNGMNILINKEAYAGSMDGEMVLASETAQRNSYHGITIMDEADMVLYNLPTIADYISSVVGTREYSPYMKGYSDIRSYYGLILDDKNIMNVINQIRTDKLKGEKYSNKERRKKIL